MKSVMSLRSRHCEPREERLKALSAAEILSCLEVLLGWELSADGKVLSRSFALRDFMTCIDGVNKIAALAEEEGHHPDIHLTGYRTLRIDLWTHSIGTISMNDIILAAKIDSLGLLEVKP